MALSILPANANAQTTAVLELFTSQGCGSCPVADALLGRYIDSGEYVALTYPVDYWDFRGWRDTLARHEFTMRQKAYSDRLGSMGLATPQIVVNGQVAVDGSVQGDIDAVLSASSMRVLPVSVHISIMADALRVNIEGAPIDDTSTAAVWLAAFDRYVAVPVEEGENRGLTLSYHNVVRTMHRVAMWRGNRMSLEIPLSMLREAGADGCAVLVQQESGDGTPGTIIGAASLTPRGGYTSH